MAAATGIRAATREDAATIAAVHATSWQETYRNRLPDSVLADFGYSQRLRMWSQVLETLPPPWVFVHENAGEIAGFVSAAPTGSDEAEITCLYLLQRAQGRGMGRALFDWILRYLGSLDYEEAYLSVLRGSPACQFYERMDGRHAEDAVVNMAGCELPVTRYRWLLKEPAETGLS